MANHDELTTIDQADLASINGGNWDDFLNVLKGGANGLTNAANFLHDHPVEAGKFGTFGIGGQRMQTPFTNDPLSRVGVRDGRPVPAK
jgi:hypothetical protein